MRALSALPGEHRQRHVPEFLGCVCPVEKRRLQYSFDKLIVSPEMKEIGVGDIKDEWTTHVSHVYSSSEIEIPVQVNGKLRVVIKVPANITQADLETAAKNSAEVKPFTDGKTIKKIIVVPKKLVNIVVV